MNEALCWACVIAVWIGFYADILIRSWLFLITKVMLGMLFFAVTSSVKRASMIEVHDLPTLIAVAFAVLTCASVTGAVIWFYKTDGEEIRKGDLRQDRT